jgi:hypothetical protein
MLAGVSASNSARATSCVLAGGMFAEVDHDEAGCLAVPKVNLALSEEVTFDGGAPYRGHVLDRFALRHTDGVEPRLHIAIGARLVAGIEDVHLLMARVRRGRVEIAYAPSDFGQLHALHVLCSQVGRDELVAVKVRRGGYTRV